MIYLKLFLAFLKIGAFTFGGGYAMIALVRETVLANGWLTEAEVINFIAVAESTPGPIAVNMATFVGSSQAGILGSAAATLGIVLPSFIIILLIAALLRQLLKYRGVQAFLNGIRPCVVALIFSTAVTMALKVLLGFSSFIGPSGTGTDKTGTAGMKLSGLFSVNRKGLVIFAILIAAAQIWKHFNKKKPSAIVMILISAALGIVFYGTM